MAVYTYTHYPFFHKCREVGNTILPEQLKEKNELAVANFVHSGNDIGKQNNDLPPSQSHLTYVYIYRERERERCVIETVANDRRNCIQCVHAIEPQFLSPYSGQGTLLLN